MNGFLGRSLLTLLVIFSLASFSACGSGGADAPFVFSGDGSGGEPSGSPTPPPGGGGGSGGSCSADTDCAAGQVCQSGTCVAGPSTGCTSNDQCTDGKICQGGSCADPECTTDGDCTGGKVCQNSHCVNPGLGGQACQVELAATLTLKIDDGVVPFNPVMTGHYDSPSTCEQYSGSGGNPGPLDPASIGANLVPPSNNTDLYCCSAAQEAAGAEIGQDAFGNDLFCDTENRHDGALEVAATRWKPTPQSAKIKLKFDLTDGCRVSILTDEFPKYYLENSALDASLIIDAGADYQTFPNGIDFDTASLTYPTRRLNEPEEVGDCSTSTDANGNIQVAVTGLPLRFFVQLFANATKDCLFGSCGGSSFTLRKSGDTPDSFQIIPGFSLNPLALTTGPSTQEPLVPAQQPAGAMTVQGEPLHYDPETNESRMTLVTTLFLPQGPGGSVSRDDDLGIGIMQNQLVNAILSAELAGRVTKQDGSPIRTQADLVENCGGGIGGSQTLSLSMNSTFGASQESLTVNGDPEHPADPFTAEACVPGTHADGNCVFASDLPFAKEVGTTDPLPGVEAKFVQDGTLVIQNAGASTASMVLQVPATAGAFRILHAEDFQNNTLVPGESATLHVFFEPVMNPDVTPGTPGAAVSGCTRNGGFVDCQTPLSISSSHSVTVTLKGRAKVPAAELKLEELATTAPNAIVGDPLIPGTVNPSVDFGEATVGVETKSKLYKISNTGVRPLVVTNILAQDVSRNFRTGSVYQGPDFENREWKIGQKPWTVNPSGDNSIFFFLNYGPFGRVSDQSAEQTCGEALTQPTRCDGSTLFISTVAAGNSSILLSGKATRDTRAVLEVYFQDDKRFLVTDDDDNPAGFEGPEHLYLAERPLEADQVFSFRQDTDIRFVYLRNGNGSPSQLDSLVLTAVPVLSGTNPDKFTFTPSVTATPEAPLVVAPYEMIKIGEMTFPPAVGATYEKFFANLPIVAQSRPPTEGAASRAPIIGGYFTAEGAIDKTHAADTVNLKIGRSVNAPNETKNLRIHRLFAGFDGPLITTASLMVSSTTRGIATRAGLTVGALNQFTEIYNIDSALNFNAENGTVTLNPIFTPVDPTSSTSAVPGVRLFNGPGSKNGPGASLLTPTPSYHFECVNSGGQCGFFYIYIGGWNSTGRPSSPQPLPCGNKPPISAEPGDNAPPAALDPRVPAEAACMQHPANGIAPATGIFDPVTGEITFSNLAIRLFAPNTPGTDGDNKNLDTTLHLALTTECITPELVPDTTAVASRLVPPQTLGEIMTYVTDFGFPNPLTEYVGDQCSNEREMHGRRMGVADSTNTLDNLGSLSVGDYNFDLVAVGKVHAGSMVTSAPFTQANKMMYIVIKAEAGHTCANGSFVPEGSMCSPPE